MPTPDYIARLRSHIGHDTVFVPTVTVVARDAADRILLVHDRDADQWTLPGGIMEPDETPADAAVRELWEEVGVVVRLTRLVGVIGGPGCRGRYRNGDQLAWVCTVFAGRVPDACTFTADGAEVTEARLWDVTEFKGLRLSTHVERFLDAEARAEGSAHFDSPRWSPPAAP